MKNNKRLYIIFGIILLIFIIIISYMRTQALVGVSEDGKWEVYYRREFGDPKKTWGGFIYWEGEENINEAAIARIKNGEVMSGDTGVFFKTNSYKPSMLEILAFGGKPKTAFLYAGFGEKPKKEDVMEVAVKWKEGGEMQETKIILRRAFPMFLK